MLLDWFLQKISLTLRALQSAYIQGEARELQRGSVKVILPSAKAAVNERQLEWLRTFAAALRAMQPAKPGDPLVSTGSYNEPNSRHRCNNKEAWGAISVERLVIELMH